MPTVLAKIFGFYSIGFKNSATGKSMHMDVLVMENLFYQRNVKKVHYCHFKGTREKIGGLAENMI